MSILKEYLIVIIPLTQERFKSILLVGGNQWDIHRGGIS